MYLTKYASKSYWSHCVVNIRKSIWVTISINWMWMLYAYNVLTLSIRKIVPISRRVCDCLCILFVIHFFKDIRIVSRPLSQHIRPLLISLIENIILGLSLFTFFKNTNEWLFSERIPSGYVIGSTSHDTTQQQSELSEVMSSLKRSSVIPAARWDFSLDTLYNASFQDFYFVVAIPTLTRQVISHSFMQWIISLYSRWSLQTSSTASSPEEAVADMLQSAIWSATAHSPLSGGPYIVFIPAIDIWLSVVPSSVWHTVRSSSLYQTSMIYVIVCVCSQIVGWIHIDISVRHIALCLWQFTIGDSITISSKSVGRD